MKLSEKEALRYAKYIFGLQCISYPDELIRELVQLFNLDATALNEALVYLHETQAHPTDYITSYRYMKDNGGLQMLQGRTWGHQADYFKEWVLAQRTEPGDMSIEQVMIICKDICWSSETEEEAIKRIEKKLHRTPTVRFRQLNEQGEQSRTGTVQSPNSDYSINF